MIKVKAPAHGTVVAYLALFFAMGGTAVAATGGSFLLGRNNGATAQTRLVNTGSGPVLALGTKTGQVPLAVSPGAGKATNLNADRIDGLDSLSLQRSIGRSCPTGQAVDAIMTDGTISCVAVEGQAAQPSPSPAASPSPSPTGPTQVGGTFSDKGFTLTDLQLGPDSVNDWDGRGRITNNNSGTQSASFTVSVFRNGAVVATLSGNVSSLASGATNTVDFLSNDDYSSDDFTVTFQTDFATNG